MGKSTSSAALIGGSITYQPWVPSGTWQPVPADGLAVTEPGKAYLVQTHSSATAKVLEAMLPALDRLLSERVAAVREQKLEELVDFMAGQMMVPSSVDIQMAQRVGARHARALNEFGFVTAEQLADMNQSRASNRHALADNWKKRRQVFSVRHRDAAGRQREVFPLFQFEDHKPIKAIQWVLEAFGERKAPWKLALWFTSNNGWLAAQARPVDLLASDPEAVAQAARRDAAGSAA